MIERLSTILPERIVKSITGRLNPEKLYEVRLRAGKPVCVNYGSTTYFLTDLGLSGESDSAIVTDGETVKSVVVKATDYSLYAVNDQLRQGFLTLAGGIRIGIAGEVVSDGGSVKTVKHFSSVNIRIPHEVKGAADQVYRYCVRADGQIHNALILSPPGAGKTTVLRDLSRLLGNRTPATAVLLADERNELSASAGGNPALDIGVHTDIIVGCEKNYAFTAGIRALAPKVIITDELSGEQDARAVAYASGCGVKIIASVHAENHTDLLNKSGFGDLIKNKVFARFVDLSARNGPGTVEGVFDADFQRVAERS